MAKFMKFIDTEKEEEEEKRRTDIFRLSGAGCFKSINFVQSISKKDKQKKNRDIVHVLLITKKHQTFVTVTDARGNKKTGASAGCRKGRSRLSRHAVAATAEHVGRSARKIVLKSVVMKVKGSTYFKKKKKVILSWKEGFQGEKVGVKSPIMYIHDVTQLAHNGCRLPKKRRVQTKKKEFQKKSDRGRGKQAKLAPDRREYSRTEDRLPNGCGEESRQRFHFTTCLSNG